MGRLGFGFRSGGRRMATSAGLTVIVTPSAAWTGVEGSGFSGAPPADPVRVTAKPACRLITPPRQWFTDYQLVGVMAAANANGSLLDTLGLEKVIVHYEGNSLAIPRPSFQTLRDANGTLRTYYGWWAYLRHDGRNGFAHVYFEAVPRDATMQRRVIGPYLYAPQASQHLLEVEVAATPAEIPGQRYRTIGAALAWLKGQDPTARNPRLTITEAGTYDMTVSSGVSFAGLKGYVTIEASVPGVVIGKTGYTTDAEARLKHNAFPLHIKGANITLDLWNVTELDGGLGGYNDGMHWLDGIAITSTSPLAPFDLLRGEKTDQFGWRVRGYPWLTECQISRIADSMSRVSLARGCTLDRVTYDIATQSLCVMDCRVIEHTGAFWNTDWNVASVTYTGPEATATLERSGGAAENGATFTARWGSSSATFEVGNAEDYYTGTRGNGYDVGDVVAWLNTLPGWNATLLMPEAETWIAARLSTQGKKGTSFAATNVKDTTLALFVGWHRHADFFQHGAGDFENAIFWGNTVELAETQNVFISTTKTNGHSRDIVFVNNVFRNNPVPLDFYDPTAISSQLGRANNVQSHIVLVHNTWVNQRLLIRADVSNFTMDSYCLIAGNTMRALDLAGGGTEPNVVLADNHVHGGTGTPAGSTGTTAGGDDTTLFVDAANADFRPAGALLANLKPRRVKFDRTATPRAPSDAAGALAM